MASAARKLLSVEEFLELEFSGDEGFRVELDNGVISMMAGGSARRARIQRNLIAVLYQDLKGTECSPYGSDVGVRTHGLSLRYPDVSVFCGRDEAENDLRREFDDPRVVIEILSPSTTRLDLEVKLPEYCATPSLEGIVYIDPAGETVQVFRRTSGRGWIDQMFRSGDRIDIPGLNTHLDWADIFAR